MRAIGILVLVLLFADISPATNATSRTEDKWTADVKALVFEGKVERLEATPVHRWIVRMSVDKVLEGNYSGTNFSFTVHSPAKSGLVTGMTYKVQANMTDFGYTVDEHQWNK